jgi:hypothetical protein
MKTTERAFNRRKNRGSSLVEVLVASSISAFVMTSLILALLSGMKSWTIGQGKINAEVSSAQGMRSVISELREAMLVTIDNNGMGITFQVPARQNDGTYSVPPVSDGVNRRIYYQSSTQTIRVSDNTGDRALARYVINTDPSRNGASYRLFTATRVSTVIRQVDVRIVAQTNSSADDYNTSRARETVVLRNVPVSTQ